MKDTFYFIEPNSELDRKKRELYARLPVKCAFLELVQPEWLNEAEQDRWVAVIDTHIEQMLDKEGEENS